MKVGMMFANVGPFTTREGAEQLAEAADEFGIESLWTVEHVVVPEGYESAYPYSSSGRMPGNETAPVPDPLAWLAFIAARTQHVRLATGVLILPQRNPAILAKECATIDVLSGGRLTLGVGIGWLAEEFAVIGVPFDERVDRTEEHIEALRALWSSDETFAGRFTRFDKARSYPKPVQSSIPIVVGGHTKAAARRAGRFGDGYFPARPDKLDIQLPALREAAADAGRDPDGIEITTGGPPNADFAKGLRDQGVHRMVVPPPTFDPSDIKRAFGELRENLIEKI